MNKPLEEWTAQEVVDWFKHGKWSKYADNFGEIDGESLASLQEKQFVEYLKAPPIVAASIYNSVQTLKSDKVVDQGNSNFTTCPPPPKVNLCVASFFTYHIIWKNCSTRTDQIEIRKRIKIRKSIKQIWSQLMATLLIAPSLERKGENLFSFISSII